jgi:RNA polymerase sigma factor (sigma-70 family)
MAGLSLVRSGDSARDRFEALVAPHYAVLFRIAFRFCGSQADAEDLVQETCARAFRRLDKFLALDDPRGWMIYVMRRVFIDQTRRYDRNHVSPLDEESDGPIACGQPGPAELAESDLMAQKIQRNLKKLSKEHSTLLVLHDMEGYSLAELEQLTGIAIGTIKSRLHRARVKLGRLLRADLAHAASGRDARA